MESATVKSVGKGTAGWLSTSSVLLAGCHRICPIHYCNLHDMEAMRESMNTALTVVLEAHCDGTVLTLSL